MRCEEDILLKPLRKSFAKRLHALREERNLSREQLAESAGLTRQAIHLYESGERRPTWDAVQALAKALNVPTDAFRDAK